MRNLFLVWDRIPMCFNKQKTNADQSMILKSPQTMFSGGICLFILCFVLALSSSILAAKKINIVTVNDDFASIASSVGKDLVNVQSLVHGSKNMHDINPKPSMVMKVKKADLIIRLGMSQDGWVDGLIQVARNPKLFSNQDGYLDASKNIQKLEVPTEDIDGSQGDIHKEGNPHYWLNPMNGIIIANDIRNHLVAIDPGNKGVYDANFNEFSKKISSKMISWKKEMAKVQSSMIISYHKVWAYFYDAFELQSIGTLELHPGIPPTISHLKNLKQSVLEYESNIIVITTNFYPKNIGQSFAKDINAKFKVLYTNVGEGGISSYTDLFDYLVAEITK